jgi:hypothetical protein
MSEEIVDADKSWEGEGSLDEHRQKEFSKIKHPGFGKSPETTPTDPPADIAADAAGEDIS